MGRFQKSDEKGPPHGGGGGQRMSPPSPTVSHPAGGVLRCRQIESGMDPSEWIQWEPRASARGQLHVGQSCRKSTLLPAPSDACLFQSECLWRFLPAFHQSADLIFFLNYHNICFWQHLTFFWILSLFFRRKIWAQFCQVRRRGGGWVLFSKVDGDLVVDLRVSISRDLERSEV